MGFLDFLPCCGPRKDKVKDSEAVDTATLLPPTRPESIVSADSLANYGATEQQGLTDEQMARIAAIGRQVGNHMLPVSTSPQNRTSSPIRRLSTSSIGSSRPPSPSPERPDTNPLDGKIQSSASGETLKPEGDEVVRKNLFAGGNLGGGGGKGKKGKKNKGKGKKNGKK
ncbi:hypothetical protein I350_07576 [Cryptococcus amylolentus CBS 6273]|uniref:Uncharacterized protein n=1 Tax=Cryptococcus amylolentus CBS 6273 TaxID=1296118 RepID=A0A1E3JAR7_9TREE|nr:hypothetical protein I350_07576 [Cryptococcus amylolentus CBS 6273]